jgi:hypothetical protein
VLEPTVIPYQTYLRELGDWLDERSVSAVAILEAPTGFVVTYESGDTGQPKLMEKFFLFRDIDRTARESGRTVRMQGEAKSSALSREPGGYRNLLRAIGLELQEQAAHSIVIDEVGSQLLLTYQVILPSKGYGGVKRIRILGPSERQALREKARKRRQHWWKLCA